MNVLLTGASGQVARSLRELLPAMAPAWTVVSLGRPRLDITEPESISAAFDQTQPDIVINTAAYTAVDQAEAEPRLAHAVNADGPACLARECARRNIPLIHFSTDYVFDGRKDTPYVEDDPVAPLNVYGRTKLAGENNVRELCPKHIILRTSWVYSPFGSNFVRTMLRLARQHRELGIVCDQIGTPTSALHIARAVQVIISHALHHHETASFWGTWHMAGTGHASWHDLAAEIFCVSRSLGGPWAEARPIASAEYPTPALRPANSRLDCSRLERALNIRLPQWTDGVRECVERLLAEERTGETA